MSITIPSPLGGVANLLRNAGVEEAELPKKLQVLAQLNRTTVEGLEKLRGVRFPTSFFDRSQLPQASLGSSTTVDHASRRSLPASIALRLPGGAPVEKAAVLSSQQLAELVAKALSLLEGKQGGSEARFDITLSWSALGHGSAVDIAKIDRLRAEVAGALVDAGIVLTHVQADPYVGLSVPLELYAVQQPPPAGAERFEGTDLPRHAFELGGALHDPKARRPNATTVSFGVVGVADNGEVAVRVHGKEFKLSPQPDGSYVGEGARLSPEKSGKRDVWLDLTPNDMLGAGAVTFEGRGAFSP